MIEDDVLREVRAAREAYAQAHGYDVQTMVAHLRSRDAAGDWPVVRHPPRPVKPLALSEVAPNEPLQPTGPA